MQAIITKYLPATNIKGSRIKASCERGSVTVSYDSGVSEQEAHVEAVDVLVARFLAEDEKTYGTEQTSNPWGKARACGQIPSGEYVHVFNA